MLSSGHTIGQRDPVSQSLEPIFAMHHLHIHIYLLTAGGGGVL